MALTKEVTVNFGSATNYKRWLNLDQYLQIVGDYVLYDGILKYIARGDSPVSGYKRFAGYKADRSRGSGNTKYLYPNSVKKKYPNKLRRPVNLYLSGAFLGKLNVKKTKDGNNVKVGMFNMTSKQRQMFDAHNEGKNKYIPQRKFLPTKKGEQFKTAIMQNFIKGVERSLKINKVFDK